MTHIRTLMDHMIQIDEGRMKDIFTADEEGKSAKEIAKALKLPLGTVKKILGEDNELQEFSSTQLDILAKQYASLKGKTISVDNANKLRKIFDKIPDGILNDLRKKKIPFLSGLALSRMIQKGIPVKEEVLDEANIVFKAKAKEGGYFLVLKRDTSGMSGSQDKFIMRHLKGNKVKELGSHPSLDGAKTFGKNKGIIEEVELDEGVKLANLVGKSIAHLGMYVELANDIKKEYFKTNSQVSMFIKAKADQVLRSVPSLVKDLRKPGIWNEQVEDDKAYAIGMPVKESTFPPKDSKEKPKETPKEGDAKSADALEKQLVVATGQINLLKQKIENEKNKVTKPAPNKETGEVPLTVGIAYKHLKDKLEKEKEEKKEEVKEAFSVQITKTDGGKFIHGTYKSKAEAEKWIKWYKTGDLRKTKSIEVVKEELKEAKSPFRLSYDDKYGKHAGFEDAKTLQDLQNKAQKLRSKGFKINKMGRNTSPVEQKLPEPEGKTEVSEIRIRPKSIVESDPTQYGPDKVAKAMKIAVKSSGMYSKAVREIEKIGKDLSKVSTIARALKTANENFIHPGKAIFERIYKEVSDKLKLKVLDRKIKKAKDKFHKGLRRP